MNIATGKFIDLMAGSRGTYCLNASVFCVIWKARPFTEAEQEQEGLISDLKKESLKQSLQHVGESSNRRN